MVYSSGITTTAGTGTFVAASVGNNFETIPTFGATEVNTKSMSLLSQQYAPPKSDSAKSYLQSAQTAVGVAGLLALGVIFIPGDFRWAALLFMLIAVGAAVINYSDVKHARARDEDSRRAYALWERTFLCFTCGHTFIP